ncbi:hypothetical protein COO60DRAFT_1689649 [Scenedesmus sp. NREL 46B-D3]|nr:hypothetical protein COO60DRAFT_1689649 [Scenedesmus sp. NREL 46B-D3]
MPKNGPVMHAALRGLRVGLGAALGNGSTLRHGINGNARLSLRTLVFTLGFMASGMAAAIATQSATAAGIAPHAPPLVMPSSEQRGAAGAICAAGDAGPGERRAAGDCFPEPVPPSLGPIAGLRHRRRAAGCYTRRAGFQAILKYKAPDMPAVCKKLDDKCWLGSQGFKPRRSLEVVMFTSEEPTRFRLSCAGSRALAGALAADTLDVKLDENGTSFQEAANAVGYGGESHRAILDATRTPKGSVDFFVELHIEQGPLLEQEKTDIGVVTAIAAPAALEVQLYGDGGHAGAQLMPLRNDAGLAGAELALAVEAHTLAMGAGDTVGTIGIFEVSPNAVNSVPRQARLGIAAAQQLGLSTKHMVSRAYHDSLFMARIAPTGMIFIPCREGWSHRPDEFASEKDIGNGLSIAQPVTATVKDEGAEATATAIQTAISEQDGKAAALLIAQAIAAHAKPNLGQVAQPQQKAQTPIVLPALSNLSVTNTTSIPADDVEYRSEQDGTEKFAQDDSCQASAVYPALVAAVYGCQPEVDWWCGVKKVLTSLLVSPSRVRIVVSALRGEWLAADQAACCSVCRM